MNQELNGYDMSMWMLINFQKQLKNKIFLLTKCFFFLGLESFIDKIFKGKIKNEFLG